MSEPLPVPEFKGFTIQRFDVHTRIAEQKEALYEVNYQKTPCPREYDASKYIYRLFLKVQYEGIFMGGWPPIVVAIIYSGEDRKEADTMILPLVAGVEGRANASPVTAREYDKNPELIMKDHMIPMQESNPNPVLKDFFYGFLQLDYHYSEITYKPGLHTIEVKFGTGKQEGKADQWSDVQKCQWNISKYTPPSESKTLKSKKKPIMHYI